MPPSTSACRTGQRASRTGRQAFAWDVEQRNAEFERLFTAVDTRETLVDPGLRALTQQWTSASRATLARFTGPGIAGRLDALL